MTAGPAALEAADTFHPHLALVDLRLGGIDGAEVVRCLREVRNVPVIFVTRDDSAEAIRSGFRLGADDYILKPYDPEESAWRVRAVLRRTAYGRAGPGRRVRARGAHEPAGRGL